ncbi:hypothetical protein IAQ61_000059 [Plenodomus lingam]|uniref:Mur ligase central domain-containing protein n=1 Tax=Leptosphaeria maculans (strain JN3 / isolate v23.1.3 / race Av1-4-5-6-7-8) TaxID=985895 RepID=E5R471_LEPMJ|nr:hypothetical protein LEMA_P045450.1 [Plenodomus lingam JN3]KAH9881335.1 hypothetical protein IAQ61_000059 [Plenodomus lingam]CBX91839.1 hypothetical protein LEMA_P045450.1 [Plenodomus lingam JN3]
MAKIQPGLDRISQLLKNIHFPWKAIHVAGTNGKGSICHYTSSLLTKKMVRCGKFTSPHLVDRWDCISIHDKPVDESLFRKIEQHYTGLNDKENINASPFEILTATAFHIFNEERVDIGIVEVGMGGKLDATNILQNQIISVISKIARDHEAFLGTTLQEIALHKAGILRPSIPYIVNPSNEWAVHDVIDQYAKEIEAGPRLTGDSPETQLLRATPGWIQFARHKQPFQRDNVIMAIVAAREATKSLQLHFFPSQIASCLKAIRKVPIPGRCEGVYAQPVFGEHMKLGRRILLDGAHNANAARALNEHVHAHERMRTIDDRRPPIGGWPVTWVLAMTEGKDARSYLTQLLKPGDNVVTTSFSPVDGMPWVKPMDPRELLDIALSVQPGISGVHIPEGGPMRALCAAKHLVEGAQPIVLTGSLYLVGDFHREIRSRTGREYWTDNRHEADRAMFQEMLEKERIRVNLSLSRDCTSLDEVTSLKTLSDQKKKRDEEREKRELMKEQIQTLDEELKRLEEAEQSISPLSSVASAATQSASKSDGKDKSEATLATPLQRQYAKSLNDIRAKLHALETAAGIPPIVTDDAEEEGAREETPNVSKPVNSEGHDVEEAKEVPPDFSEPENSEGCDVEKSGNAST